MSLYNEIILFVLSSTAIFMGVFSIGIKTPPELRKLKTAKYLLFTAYLLLGFPALLRYFYSDNPLFMITMAYSMDIIGYGSLMLAMLLLITDSRKHIKTYLCMLTVFFISLMSCFSHRMFGVLDTWFVWTMFTTAILSYLILLLIYWKAFKAYTHKSYMRWGRVGFWSAAIMMILLFPTDLQETFILKNSINAIVFIIINIWFVISFANYVSEIRLSKQVNAVKESENSHISGFTKILATREDNFRDRLDEWVAKKEFLKQDDGIEHVARELGTDIKFMRYYFRVRMPYDFRTWRISLRIDYAKEMIKDNPDISMNQLSELSGFTSKSNFYYYFKKETGQTPTEYRTKVA